MIPAAESGEKIVLDERDSHHLTRVLRMKPGDEIIVFTPDGQEFKARLTSVERGLVHVQVSEMVKSCGSGVPVRVELCFSPPRPGRCDWLIEKATELGVAGLQPVIFARTQGEREVMAERRAERWIRVAKEAAEQSGRKDSPVIRRPMRWRRFIETVEGSYGDAAVRLIAHPGERSSPLLHVTASLSVKEGDRVVTVVGPEGGFVDNELDEALSSGFRAVSVGATVLRTETAAVVTAAVILSAVYGSSCGAGE